MPDREKQIQTPVASPLLLSVPAELALETKRLHRARVSRFVVDITCTAHAVWIHFEWPSGARLACRPVYSPESELEVALVRASDEEVVLDVKSPAGAYVIHTWIFDGERPVIRCETRLVPAEKLMLPFITRDLYPLDADGDPLRTRGIVHVKQHGPRSGMLFATMTSPREGAFMYFQNLTALNEYCDQAEVSLGDTVGGDWPELGFRLPPTAKPLQPGIDVVVSDAFVCLDEETPNDPGPAARQFFDLLAEIYVRLPRPDVIYHHWPRRVEASLSALTHAPGCTVVLDGHRYLLPYVEDHKKPPESMVQLTVLLPLIEFAEYSGDRIPLAEELLASVPRFYDPKQQTVVRFLPGEKFDPAQAEEHMNATEVDSWYLYHTLFNVSRLALRGDRACGQMFTASLDYAMRVARHFDYRWPVFFDLATLSVVKAHRAPGLEGERDVAGLYALLMLQAWDYTGDEKYLDEAKRAGKVVSHLGFGFGYQMNTTGFGAGAWLRLWQITGEAQWLEQSYVWLANVFENMWLWQCEYGHANHYRTFFGLFPLHDAPYLAAYEEFEAPSKFMEYLAIGGDRIPQSIRLLLAESCRHALDRLWYYYPSELPAHVLSEKPRAGRIERNLEVPLEDMRDGREACGQVGQEIYGAGAGPFLVTRHYHRVKGANFIVYCDYPALAVKIGRNKAKIEVSGSSRLSCRFRIIAVDHLARLPAFDIRLGRRRLNPRSTVEGHLECLVPGGSTVSLHWHLATPGGTHDRAVAMRRLPPLGAKKRAGRIEERNVTP